MPAEPAETSPSARASTVTPRVKIVHRQARKALTMAVIFGAASVVTVFLPHRTGAWLPLHLFLVGAVLLAISGATRLFTVTWAAAEPARAPLVAAQRWLIAAGAAGLTIGRERNLATSFVAVCGLCVTAGLVLLGVLLVVESQRARVRRFHPAVRFYVVATAAGVVGTGLGAAMVTGRGEFRDAHVLVNLLGLIGLVIAGTLPFFTATQARMKMSPRATAPRLHRDLAVLAGAVTAAAIATLAHHPALAGAALAAYAAALVHLTTTLPRPGRKQLAWAGPRLVQLGAGVAWWVGTVGVAAGRSLTGRTVFPEHLVVALVVGGYAQVLVASLAYLGPVLRGGGHVRLTAGFAATRSWIALAAGNVAPAAWITGHTVWSGIAIAVVGADVAVRGAVLALSRPAAV